MTANHWTTDKSPFPLGFPILNGYSYGMGVRTLVDVAQAGVPSSVGEYGWAGVESTYFWIDPHEQPYGVLMVQLAPVNLRPAWVFQVLAYQALIT